MLTNLGPGSINSFRSTLKIHDPNLPSYAELREVDKAEWKLKSLCVAKLVITKKYHYDLFLACHVSGEIYVSLISLHTK